MKNGKILQVMGPVVDVKFEDSDLPYISDALEVYVEDKKRVMEVSQHIGDDTVFKFYIHYRSHDLQNLTVFQDLLLFSLLLCSV